MSFLLENTLFALNMVGHALLNSLYRKKISFSIEFYHIFHIECRNLKKNFVQYSQNFSDLKQKSSQKRDLGCYGNSIRTYMAERKVCFLFFEIRKIEYLFPLSFCMLICSIRSPPIMRHVSNHKICFFNHIFITICDRIPLWLILDFKISNRIIQFFLVLQTISLILKPLDMA